MAGPRASAAVFDLDRTLLKGSSTAALNEAMYEEGLVSRPGVPGQGLMMRFYELFGETAASMALARAAALAARGMAVERVRAAAEKAAKRLEPDLMPWAPGLLERHRQAGHLLVLATTTPFDMVAPLAERLGIDHVVATRYRAAEDGEGVLRYTGHLEGPFVWALGKLRAVASWASSAGVDLRASWAYSDSAYDLPLLLSVGHPVAVNPDPRLLGVATLRRWPVLYLDVPRGVPKLLGLEPADLLRLLSSPLAFPYARFDIAGTENIPRSGPGILACNHRSYFDVVAVALTVTAAGRKPRGLAKKELFDAPVVGTLMRMGGAICVDRKGDPSRALVEAEEALRAGELLVIMPQGTIPRGEAFFDPKLKGKTGAARLAAATGAPVIPCGIWGSEAVWPRSSRLPNVTAVLHPPTVRVRVGPPVKGLTGRDAVADTERIMRAISALLPPEARLRRIPSAEELAKTVPPA